MNYYALIGLLSGIISIIGFFIPDRFRNNKYFLIILMLIMALGCSFVTSLNSDLARVKNVSRAANQLIQSQSLGFTDMSFIQACLSFLEQNEDLYPGSYKRALDIYERLIKKENLTKAEQYDAANEIEGIVRGIGILSNGK